MDIIDISLGAKKAVLELEKSGKVAKSTIHSRDESTPVIIGAIEDLGGLHGAIVEGTFGVKPTDLYVSFDYRDSAGVLRKMWLDKIPVASPMYVGNQSIAGIGEDTGENWLIVIDFEQNASLIFYHNDIFDGEEITIESTITYETIHPIDPKYLPGVCLPVVELSTILGEEPVVLTAEENAKLNEVVASGSPFILVCKSEWMRIIGCASIFGPVDGVGGGFSFENSICTVVAECEDGQWGVSLVLKV